MGATTGLAAIGDYVAGESGQNLNKLLALIPDPDAPTAGSGSISGGGFLDEMSPGAAAAMRNELAAMGAGDSTELLSASGSYTITAGDASANLVNITTGFDDFTLSKSSVSVWNGTTLATSDAVISKQTGGVLRIADGSTYNTVAGYVVRWAVNR